MISDFAKSLSLLVTFHDIRIIRHRHRHVPHGRHTLLYSQNTVRVGNTTSFRASENCTVNRAFVSVNIFLGVPDGSSLAMPGEGHNAAEESGATSTNSSATAVE